MPGRRPNLFYEKHFWSIGCEYVVGVDEAGVAPLAGPVVAAAVILKPGTTLRLLPRVADSKILTSLMREELFERITDKCEAFGVGLAEVEEVDSLNIHHATRLAMKRAVEQLPSCDALIVDGPFTIPGIRKLQMAVVDGDAKVASISAASIIAKVSRDRIMSGLHEQFPEYGFAKHKGYPTKQHIAKILEHGATPVHRKSFLKNIIG